MKDNKKIFLNQVKNNKSLFSYDFLPLKRIGQRADTLDLSALTDSWTKGKG